eukprot:7248953-Pyramimonas_sp.AAC.1
MGATTLSNAIGWKRSSATAQRSSVFAPDEPDAQLQGDSLTSLACQPKVGELSLLICSSAHSATRL